MLIITHVHVHVKPEYIEAFCQATLENARQSILEPGVARFDLIQQWDDPTRFLLIEIYRSTEDPVRHKETQHYRIWRERVEKMMAESRTSVRFSNVFPDDNSWNKSSWNPPELRVDLDRPR